MRMREQNYVSREPNTGCYLWSGHHDDDGYAMWSVRWRGRQRTFRLARLVYQVLHGHVPRATHVRHICHNPGCVNPGHLRAGTPTENAADSCKDGRKGSPKEMVANIFLERRMGGSVRGIAKKFGISPCAVRYHLRGKSFWGTRIRAALGPYLRDG